MKYVPVCIGSWHSEACAVSCKCKKWLDISNQSAKKRCQDANTGHACAVRLTSHSLSIVQAAHDSQHWIAGLHLIALLVSVSSLGHSLAPWVTKQLAIALNVLVEKWLLHCVHISRARVQCLPCLPHCYLCTCTKHVYAGQGFVASTDCLLKPFAQHHGH